MIERSKYFGFALETGDPVSIPSKFLRRKLDCYIAAQLLVLRLIDFAHAAFADFACDLIMAQVLPIMRNTSVDSRMI